MDVEERSGQIFFQVALKMCCSLHSMQISSPLDPYQQTTNVQDNSRRYPREIKPFLLDFWS